MYVNISIEKFVLSASFLLAKQIFISKQQREKERKSEPKQEWDSES